MGVSLPSPVGVLSHRRGDLARELQRMDSDAADGTSDAQGLASYLASSLGTLRSEKHA